MSTFVCKYEQEFENQHVLMHVVNDSVQINLSHFESKSNQSFKFYELAQVNICSTKPMGENRVTCVQCVHYSHISYNNETLSDYHSSING